MFTCFPFISVKVISVKILHLMNRSSFIIAADIVLLALCISISMHVTNSYYVQALSDSIHILMIVFPLSTSASFAPLSSFQHLYFSVFLRFGHVFWFLFFNIFISRVSVVYWWRHIYDLSIYIYTVHNIYTCSLHMYIKANIWLAVYYYLYWLWWNAFIIYLETKLIILLELYIKDFQKL